MPGRRKPAGQGGRKREGFDEEKNKTPLGLPAFPTSLKSGTTLLPSRLHSWLTKPTPGKGDGASDRLVPGPQDHIKWVHAPQTLMATWSSPPTPSHAHTHTHTHLLHSEGNSGEKPQAQVLKRQCKAKCHSVVQAASFLPCGFGFLGAFPSRSSSGVSGPLPDRRRTPGQVGNLTACSLMPHPGVQHPGH